MCFFDKYYALCKARGMSVNAVAKVLGIPSSSVTNWKHGHRPRIDSLQKIADYFHVSMDFLTNDESKDAGAEASAMLDIYLKLSPDRQRLLVEIAEAMRKQEE